MDTKVIIAGALVLLGGYWIYRRKVEDEEDINEANRATADLDDPNTKAALLFKHALQYELIGPVWGGNDVETPPEIAALYNACLNVVDWQGVQAKFSTLCNNEATLLQAMQDNTDTDIFNFAINLCKAKKVISTQPGNAYMIVYDENGNAEDEGEAKPFEANTLLGALITTAGEKVSFQNGFKSSGFIGLRQVKVTNGTTSANNVKIVDPLKQ